MLSESINFRAAFVSFNNLVSKLISKISDYIWERFGGSNNFLTDIVLVILPSYVFSKFGFDKSELL